MAKFVVRPSTPEALRQEFLNDILRRIDWLEAGAGARRVKEQAKAQSAIGELSLLLKFWQSVVIEDSPPRHRRRASPALRVQPRQAQPASEEPAK